MIDWLFGTVLGKCVMTFLISLLPVVELRGGIPYGISQGLDPWLAFAASALGNMLPVPFLLLFVRKILHWMKRYPRLGRLAVSLERRADRLKKQLKGDASAAPELALVERLIAELGAGSAARAVTLDDKERELIKPMQLLSYKPTIYAANISEEFIRRPLAENPLYTALERRAKEENAEIIAVCAEIEAEIAELDEDEQKLFLEDLGLTESGLDKLIRSSYRLLGLISYLTAGPKEVRAWTITEGTKAPGAAGKIHTDFERGFIRAEVVGFDTLMEKGSFNAAKEAGLVRSEGKDYVVRDGDVVLFRFNV